MRFNIRIDPIWRWALLVGGATSQNSYVMLGDDGMHFRFGLLFNRTVPYDQVAAVQARSWPLLSGIGWRSDLRGIIGITGSYHDVVEVKLKKRIGNWAGVFPVDRICVSLEEPEVFIAEVSGRAGLAERTPARPEVSKDERPANPRQSPRRRTADSGPPTAKANGSKAPPKPAQAQASKSARKPAAQTGRSSGRTAARPRRSRRA